MLDSLDRGLAGVNKALMIRQGYVPATCTMPEDLASRLIWSEIIMGRDPCAGCYADRAACGGRPNLVELKRSFGPGPENDAARASREAANRVEIQQYEEKLAQERERLRREDEIYGHIHGPHEIIKE